MASRIRRSSSGSDKKLLKGKIVQIYESFLRGEDPSLDNHNFWDEFFLLRPKISILELELSRLNGEQLLSLKEMINKFFSQCIQTLHQGNQIRTFYALLTLCGLLRGIYKRTGSDFGFDVINTLMGFESAERLMSILVDAVCSFLREDNPVLLQSLCLKLLLTILTGTDNVSQNKLLEYLMMNSVFEALVQILSDAVSRQAHGHDAVLILTALVNYRKYEASNPYIVKLSILDNELALNGYGQVVAASLGEFNKKYAVQVNEAHSTGFLSTITNVVGNFFVADDNTARTQHIRANVAMLLALYEAVHLNRNFMTVLTHSQAELGDPVPPPADDPESPPPTPDLLQSSNLLVTFFEYCSILMQDSRSDCSGEATKLCWLILTCISEDQYANSLMHDPNLVLTVTLYRMPMRHRTREHVHTARPLAASLLDLMVEFIATHLMKRLPMELYMLSLGIIQRLLCYQKRCRVRLSYSWTQLWTALIYLLKFLLTNESLAKKINVFHLAQQVVTILNLFITYGDNFLSSPSSYDELYYEIIRLHQVFDNLHSMALRYSTIEGEWKDSALKLTNSLVNIRAIINHFSHKIEASHGPLTEEEVLVVVRDNYDSLTLKLQENLDQYERYAEKPAHGSFFTQMVRSMIVDTKQSISLGQFEQPEVIQEFSSIT